MTLGVGVKAIAATFFLSSGFFTLMIIIGQIAGWTHNIVALAIASLVFGSLATAVGSYYRRRTRTV